MARNCSSKPQWSHLEYRWTLENFWELRALASIDALEDDSVVWSPRFGDMKKGLWRLKIYPYGDSSSAGKGHVSVFLALDTTAGATAKTYAIFACYVLDAQGNKVQGSGRSFTRQKFVEGSASWGWSRFIHADDQGFTGLLVDDTLTIKCDIDIFTGVKSSPGKNLPAPITLRDELVEYLQRDASKGILLKVEGTKIPVNEVVLCARSLTFRSLLAPSTMPSPRDELDLANQQETATPTATTTAAGSDTSVLASQESLVEEGHATSGSATSPIVAKKLSVAPLKPVLPTALLPAFSDPKEFVTVQVVEQFDDDASSNDLIANKTIQVELTHPDITVYAAQQMVTYMINDKCQIFTEASPSLLSVLEVFIISTVYNVQSLRNACIELLIPRITSKADAKLILAAANKCDCVILADECRHFFQHLSPELQGSELVSLLLSTAAPSTSNHPPVTPTNLRSPQNNSVEQ